MSPSEYKARYIKLEVTLEDGKTITVKVNRYRLKVHNYQKEANDTFITKLKKNKIDKELSVHTDTGLVTVAQGSKVADWALWRIIRF